MQCRTVRMQSQSWMHPYANTAASLTNCWLWIRNGLDLNLFDNLIGTVRDFTRKLKTGNKYFLQCRCNIQEKHASFIWRVFFGYACKCGMIVKIHQNYHCAAIYCWPCWIQLLFVKWRNDRVDSSVGVVYRWFLLEFSDRKWKTTSIHSTVVVFTIFPIVQYLQT